jgi:hypothetical protein
MSEHPEYAHEGQPCPGGDPTCPGADGDWCHYLGPGAWRIPTLFTRLDAHTGRFDTGQIGGGRGRA